MSTYPTNPRSAFVEWCEAQAPVFVAQEAEIGLTKTQAVEFAATTDKARSLIVAQIAARQRWEVATREVEQIVRLLRGQAGDAVRSIRAYAELTAAPDTVYQAARIAPPADPTPMPPPGRPNRLNATLDPSSGSLTLTWKARHPAGVGGTTYLVRRRLPGETAFAFLGTAGKKTFVDDTLPPGTPTAEYTVQAQRGPRIGGLSQVLVVNFGAGDKRRNAETSKRRNVPVESLRAEMRGAGVMA